MTGWLAQTDPDTHTLILYGHAQTHTNAHIHTYTQEITDGTKGALSKERTLRYNEIHIILLPPQIMYYDQKLQNSYHMDV